MPGYTYRKGYIPVTSAPTFAHGAAGYGAYGRYWVPKKKYLTGGEFECEEVIHWYAKFIQAKKDFRQKCKWPRRGACGKRYRQQMNDYEKKGKAAKKECRQLARLQGPTEDTGIYLTGPSDVLAPSTIPGGAHGAGAAGGGLPAGTYVDPSGQVVPGGGGPVDQPITSGFGVTEPPNYLLWGGLAAGGLVLWMLLRK